MRVRFKVATRYDGVSYQIGDETDMPEIHARLLAQYREHVEIIAPETELQFYPDYKPEPTPAPEQPPAHQPVAPPVTTKDMAAEEDDKPTAKRRYVRRDLRAKE